MKYFSVIIFLICIVLGYGYEDWATCEKYPKDFMCYDWCLRLNRYTERYLNIRESTGRQWQEFTKIIINSVIPAALLVFIWIRLRKTFEARAAELKMRIHKKKLELLQKDQTKRDLPGRLLEDEKHPDSVEERPLAESVVQKMWRKKTNATRYLKFRMRKTREEREEADPERYEHTDRVQLYQKVDLLEMVAKDEADNGAYNNNLEIDNEKVEVDWQIDAIKENGQTIASFTSELDKTRKGR
ncbi:unnamed protein product [Caenorhabditis sp. 36 PRJEB53466]|nr:unnamed protein product [Caenorhabditis sp. 36 PRJEB53466]